MIKNEVKNQSVDKKKNKGLKIESEDEEEIPNKIMDKHIKTNENMMIEELIDEFGNMHKNEILNIPIVQGNIKLSSDKVTF